MHAHIVLAHPESKSFNSNLAEVARDFAATGMERVSICLL